MKRMAYNTRVALAGSEELLVSVSRATAAASARHIEFMVPRGSRMRIPLDAASRAALTVEEVDLGGVRAERYCPTMSLSGTILYFHGGGFVSGGVGQERRPAAANAIASNCDTYTRAEIGRQDAFGFEAIMPYANGSDRWFAGLERWRQAGGTHASVLTIGAGLTTVDDHIDAIESWQSAAASA